ncbi:TIGR03943 family protein [Clostridium zeae]|uniref:TIGR03943 family protein n=1 Tax=Clostridium zeae TaxID=2759022 RepID=A0ABQ1EFM0_9CLOT|nr:TIGR03943 family protein [Clostridium zeae]GFZ33471.1 TIGR03943 family protein [Clostridium zeae]
MKRFNFNEFVKFITLFLLSLFLYNLNSTGNIKLFITPKLIFYVNMFQIALVVLTLYQFKKSFTIATYKKSSKVHLLFLFTIIVGYGASKAGIDTTIVDNKGVKAINKLANVSGELTAEERAKKLPINITTENYVASLSDMFQHVSEYKGRQVTISGFIHKEQGLDTNEFVISRLYMSCCIADSQIVGPIGRIRDRSVDLKEGQWVTVIGKISEKDQVQDGQKTVTPVVVADSFQTIQKPSDPYVYLK